MATQAEIEAILKLKDEMSAKIEELRKRVGATQEKVESLKKKNTDLELGLGGLGRAFAKVSAVVTGLATGAFAVFLTKAAQAASRAQETQNLFDVSFGTMASAAEDWARRTSEAVGVNDTTLKNFSGTLFNMTTSMGLTREGAFSLATGFTQLALDTSSFFNIGFDEAFNKIRAGLAGESEPLKQLGVLVTENTVKQTDFAKAILATGRELTESEKVQGRAIVIMQGLQNAQGDLIRTQDSWANQTRLVGEAWTDFLETVGAFITESEVIGSVIAVATDSINKLSDSLKTNKGEWETVVTQGVFFFVAAGENTLHVLAFIVDGLGGVTAGLGHLLSGLSMVSRFMVEHTPAWKLLPESVKQSAEESFSAFDSVGKSLIETGTIVFETGGKIREGAEAVGNTLLEMVNNAGKAKDETAGASSVASTYSDTMNALSGNISNANGAIEMSEKQLKAQAQAAKEAEKALRELHAAGQAQFTGLLQTESAVKAVETNWYGATDAIFAGTEATHEARIQMAALAAGYKDSTIELKALELKTFDWGNAMDSVNDFLSETRGLMSLLGIESDSVFGKMIGWASKLFDAFNSVTGMFSKLAGVFGGGGGAPGGGGLFGGLFKGLGSLLGLGGGGIPGGSALVSSGIGTGGIGASAAATGAAGGGIGISALAATGYGAIAVGAIFAIRAALKKASAETTAEFLGIDFEVLSKGLQTTLQDMGKQVGDFATAIQLNLSQVFAEGGIGNIDSFAEKMADTFSFLDRKQIDAAEAQKVLGETVQQLLPNISQMGAAGVQQLERLLAAADRTGVSFAGIDELAMAYVQRANELGVAVNNVVLESLGLQSALATAAGPVAGAAVPLPGTAVPVTGAAGEAAAMQASAFSEVAPEIGQVAGDTISKQLQPEFKGIKDEVGALGRAIEAAVARAVRDARQLAPG